MDLVFLNLPRVTRIASSITVSSGEGGAFVPEDLASDFSALVGTASICLAADWLELSGAWGIDNAFFRGLGDGEGGAAAEVDGSLAEVSSSTIS